MFNYLKGLALCTDADQDLVQIDSIPAKNFNLLVTLSSGHKYLVKQERYASDGKTAGDFLNEWRIQEFWQQSRLVKKKSLKIVDRIDGFLSTTL
jgi:hypothetical protein